MFKNREDAGEKLAEELQERDIDADLVLTIPRGGLPLGRKVADALEAPLDVVVARKIGAPGNPELAIGAVASNGSHWLNEEMIERQSISDDFIEKGIEEEAENAKKKLEFMREGSEALEIEGKKVVLVDDGIATGATMIACLRQLRDLDAEQITVAVPVAPEDIKQKLQDEADKIIVLETPAFFGAVGSHYDNFEQVTDSEAKKYLS
jgi:putative phosphoribosyl transferase